jgi:hypothetical protein
MTQLDRPDLERDRDYLRLFWSVVDDDMGRIKPTRSVRILRWVALHALFGLRIIWSRDGHSPYLLRVSLTPRLKWWPAFPVVFLHFFFRGDDDKELHSHPWDAISIPLSVGYKEERLFRLGSTRGVVAKWRRPFRAFRIRKTDFHRVRLHASGRPWTLFIAGERTELPEDESWGFLDVMTGRYTPWRRHVDEKRAALKQSEREAA